MKRCGDLMSKSLSQLQSHPSFARLEKEGLRFILKKNDLSMKEVDLFHLALRWAKNQSGLTQQESLEEILPYIRFPVMTLEKFTHTVVPTGLLSQAKVIELFTYFGSDAETKKSLARKLEFSNLRRNSSDYIASVPIYYGDYETKVVKTRKYHKLQEDLHPKRNKSLPLWNYDRCDDEETIVGLNGISVYCPAWQGRYWGRCFTKFNITVMAREHIYEYRNHQELLTKKCGVEIEEGKVAEIKFRLVIPVKNRTKYYISIEEAPSDSSSTITQRVVNMDYYLYTYLVKDFGYMADRVDVNIGNKCQVVLELKGGFGYLICKLNFEEL